MKKIIVTGNIGRDPEIRAAQDGTQFATFSIGVSVGTKQSPKTDWVDITCNGKLSEIARLYVKKGDKILVEGFPSVNAYLNRENKPVGTLRIYANNIELLGNRKEEQATHAENYTLPEAVNVAPVGGLTSDDIPF